MKKYARPFIEIVRFDTEDIILTSGTGNLTDGGSVGDFTEGGAQGGWGTTSSASLFDNR